MKSLEELKYPIGQFISPTEFTTENMNAWSTILKEFPQKVKNEVQDLTSAELQQTYRPEGWTIQQIVHHCADSHMNSFMRFKLALTEELPTIKPYEEQLWAELPDTTQLDINISLHLLEALHHRWTFLIENLTENEWNKEFIHPATNNRINLKTNLAMYAWHCEHHLTHIKNAKNLAL